MINSLGQKYLTHIQPMFTPAAQHTHLVTADSAGRHARAERAAVKTVQQLAT